MTKKDYELIAGVIQGGLNYEQTFNDNEKGVKAVQSIAHTFAIVLASTNPRFNEDIFLKACGVK